MKKLVVVGIALICCCMVFVSPQSLKSAGDDIENSGALQEFLRILERNFVGKTNLTSRQIEEAAIRGIAASLGQAVQIVETNSPVTTNRFSTNDVSKVEMIAPEMGYIRVERVGEGSVEKFAAALDQLNTQQIKALVLDLRFAEGTNYHAPLEMGNLMLSTSNEVFRIENSASSQNETFKALGRKKFSSKPLMILMNRETQGGAEVFAGILRDEKVGLTIGQPSSGKALVFQDFELPSGLKLQVATGRIVLSKSGSIYPGGVPVDVEVKVDSRAEGNLIRQIIDSKDLRATLQAKENRRFSEADLVKQRSGAFTNLPVEEIEPAGQNREFISDPVLQRAMDIIHGLRALNLISSESRQD